MIAYFETSALIKLAIEEPGSAAAGATWDGADSIATSRLSYAEARAALASARRAGRLSSAGLSDAKDALEGRFRELDLVEVADPLVRFAGDLAELHGLRGYDAVQLASALALGEDELVLATWDRDLASAGAAEGVDLAGIHPG